MALLKKFDEQSSGMVSGLSPKNQSASFKITPISSNKRLLNANNIQKLLGDLDEQKILIRFVVGSIKYCHAKVTLNLFPMKPSQSVEEETKVGSPAPPLITLQDSSSSKNIGFDNVSSQQSSPELKQRAGTSLVATTNINSFSLASPSSDISTSNWI